MMITDEQISEFRDYAENSCLPPNTRQRLILLGVLDALEAERARVAVLEEAIEVYALPLLWALKMDGKLNDGTTAENFLRSVVKPKATLPTPPEGGSDE